MSRPIKNIIDSFNVHVRYARINLFNSLINKMGWAIKHITIY